LIINENQIKNRTLKFYFFEQEPLSEHPQPEFFPNVFLKIKNKETKTIA
jgi:hypothetical protein